MLTPEQLRAMTAEEHTAMFEDLAERFYGTNQYTSAIARDLDVSRPTIFRWKRDNTVPWPVLFTLESWTNKPDRAARRILDDFASIPADLIDAAKAMQKVALTLGAISRRLPAAPDAAVAHDDTEASSHEI